MATPQGGYSPGSAGTGVGAFSYLAGTTQAQYFGGTFFIDTGHDDPVIYTAGTDPAEVYQARVYVKTSTTSGTLPAGTYLGKWLISATPVWTSKQWATPHSNVNVQARIFIKCDCYLMEPFSKNDGFWERIDSVDWGLYRV